VIRHHANLRYYLSKWNRRQINRESIYGPCNVISKPSAEKFAMSLHSSTYYVARHEYVTKSNGQIGTEVRHPLSVEKEPGSQTYASRYEADPWARRMLKCPNCTMRARLRTRQFFMHGGIEAWKTGTQFGAALSGFHSKYPFASARIIVAHFRVARDSVKMIPARNLGHEKLSRRWLPHQPSDAQKKSRVEFSRDLLQFFKAAGGCNSTE
jgi:hypothetical protein